MRSAFIAGATGYTGREVVRRLASQPVNAIAHVRPDSPALARARELFAAMHATVDVTPWDLPAITATIRAHQPDVVFALLGTTQARANEAARSGAPAADYEAVDYGMTHMLIEAVKTAAPHATFVYLSAMGASTHSRSEYMRVRGRVEHELMTSGLTYIIARPLFVSGNDREERRVSERVGAVVTDAALAVLGLVAGNRFRDRFRSITGERLAKALIDAARDPAARNCVMKAHELQQRARR